MKDLIIVCAGGFGKEALNLAEIINRKEKSFNILGFLDDTFELGTEIYHGYKVIGNIKTWQPTSNQIFVLGIATPSAKEKLYNLLKIRGAEFATLISPSVNVPVESVIGEGCVITGISLGCNVKLGKCVNMAGSMIGSSEIGDFSTTTGFANIAAAKLGKRVFVGSHAVILNGRKVGDDAFICAGSIVFNHVKPGIKVMGNPAKKVDF